MGSPVYKSKAKKKEMVFNEIRWRWAELILSLLLAFVALYIGTVIPRMLIGRESFIIEMVCSIGLLVVLFPLRTKAKSYVMKTHSLRKYFET